MKHLLLSWLFAIGCQHATASSLPLSVQDDLEMRVAQIVARGSEVYTGRVQPRGPEGPTLFRYRRFVFDHDGDSQVSSHVTRGIEDERVVVLHEALTTPDGRLTRFNEWHTQTGLWGSMVVDEDHTATFDVTADGQRTQRVEAGDDPVHAGPSLFAYVLNHWDALVAGEPVRLRFPVLADARTYRFTVRVDPQSRGDTTVFEMRGTSAFVRLAVPTMALHFDTEDRTPLRYEGLVPPHEVTSRGLRALDGRVDYTLARHEYR